VRSYELLLDFNCLVQLLNIHVHFHIQKLEKKLVVGEKELQQARKDNQSLAQYINAKRKKEDAQKKTEEEARKKTMEMEGQSSKDVRTWRK
jgi:predicted Holliday junction resolvase-like endonuclease